MTETPDFIDVQDPSGQGVMYMGPELSPEDEAALRRRPGGTRIMPAPPAGPAAAQAQDERAAALASVPGAQNMGDVSQWQAEASRDTPYSHTLPGVSRPDPPSPGQEALNTALAMGVPLKQAQEAVRAATVFQLGRQLQERADQLQRLYAMPREQAMAQAQNQFGPLIIAAGGQKPIAPRRYNVQGVGLVDEAGKVITPIQELPPDIYTDPITGQRALINRRTGALHKLENPQQKQEAAMVEASRKQANSQVVASQTREAKLRSQLNESATDEARSRIVGNIAREQALRKRWSGRVSPPMGAGGSGAIQPPATSTGTQSAPKPDIGEVRGGYRFKGGDPSKKENWEKV